MIEILKNIKLFHNGKLSKESIALIAFLLLFANGGQAYHLEFGGLVTEEQRSA